MDVPYDQSAGQPIGTPGARRGRHMDVPYETPPLISTYNIASLIEKKKAEAKAESSRISRKQALIEIQIGLFESTTMRKQFKDKARSCALCKPHKRGWDRRWKPRQRQALLEAEKEIRAALKN
jgi:hypothetical protein